MSHMFKCSLVTIIYSHDSCPTTCSCMSMTIMAFIFGVGVDLVNSYIYIYIYIYTHMFVWLCKILCIRAMFGCLENGKFDQKKENIDEK